MATATTRKRTTPAKAQVRNPARKMLVGGRKRTTRRRTSAVKTPVRRARRTTYRRNPSASSSSVLFAIGGALVISVFDYGITRFLPQISNPLRIGGKVAAGWALGKYGKKLLGNWASVGETALYLAAAIDLINVYLKPTVFGWLGGSDAPVVGTQKIKDTATGQLGMRYHLADGNAVDRFPSQQAAYA
jgi:hypothetical protein